MDASSKSPPRREQSGEEIFAIWRMTTCVPSRRFLSAKSCVTTTGSPLHRKRGVPTPRGTGPFLVRRLCRQEPGGPKSDRWPHPCTARRGIGAKARARLSNGGVSLIWGNNRLVRMTSIAASVAAPNIIDHRLRFFMLHLERRDQRVLRQNGHASALTCDVYSNSEFERHAPISSKGTLETRRPPA
jgi:hypothetical protein